MIKRNLYLLSMLFFSSINCFSQNLNDDSAKRNNCTAFFEFPTEDYTEAEDCNRAKKCALTDIKNGVFILYTSAGMTPRNEKDTKTVKQFQTKYQLKYSDFGCVAPNYNCVKNYNSQVFNYLKVKYGKNWIKKLDKWVIGFSEWELDYNK